MAIASVVQARGSVPGKPGARLAISSSGVKFGTVGGAGATSSITGSPVARAGGGGGGSTYIAGTGLTLVGTEFNTANTGNFSAITFDNGN